MTQVLTLVPPEEAEQDVDRSAAPASAPPGWYPDSPRLRFWDGRGWTDETRMVEPPPPVLRPMKAVPTVKAVRLVEAVPPTPLPEPDVVGLLPAHAPVAPAPAAVHDGGLVPELLMLFFVLALAITAGALVATIGIVLTV